MAVKARARIPGAPKADPWKPADYALADAAALQAVAHGRASEEQQRRAMKYIIEHLCGTYDLSYRSANPYDTSFAEGKRFVGLQIVKMINIHLSALTQEPKEQPT